MHVYDQTRDANSRRRDQEKKKFGRFNPNRPAKPKRWSHQDDLTALIGKTIVCGRSDGMSLEGVLVEADQFTLKIQTPEFALPVLVFKSALTYIAVANEA
jgi:hypothetical protein